ncbi:hypothetical protein LCGC14_1795510 [marine sediment metagenome]|uniref:Uncharacterized protein n=1 Tax=marine sediment metagenome TaxID=412755 RepID=A0A0F9J618_9ZZZZ
MNQCEIVIPVYEFRPIIKHNDGNFFRYNDGEWIIDDGEYDIAFAHPSDCMAYGFYVPSRPGIIWSWTKNGKWGAIVEGHPRGNAWHYMLRSGETVWGKCWNKYRHLNYMAKEKAMSFVCSKKGCANGAGPEFHINDPYIEKGLLRLRETKEVVKFPDIFNCMYCGDINWRKEESKK